MKQIFLQINSVLPEKLEAMVVATGLETGVYWEIEDLAKALTSIIHHCYCRAHHLHHGIADWWSRSMLWSVRRHSCSDFRCFWSTVFHDSQSKSVIMLHSLVARLSWRLYVGLVGDESMMMNVNIMIVGVLETTPRDSDYDWKFWPQPYADKEIRKKKSMIVQSFTMTGRHERPERKSTRSWHCHPALASFLARR